MPVDPRLMEILVCPVCHGELREEGQGIRCLGCARLYPIEDDIPVLLVEAGVLPGSPNPES